MPKKSCFSGTKIDVFSRARSFWNPFHTKYLVPLNPASCLQSEFLPIAGCLAPPVTLRTYCLYRQHAVRQMTVNNRQNMAETTKTDYTEDRTGLAKLTIVRRHQHIHHFLSLNWPELSDCFSHFLISSVHRLSCEGTNEHAEVRLSKADNKTINVIHIQNNLLETK